MVKKTPQEVAGKYVLVKGDKPAKGVFVTVWKACGGGVCLGCICCYCIPCAFTYYIPCGDYYLKTTGAQDCGPCCIVPNEDGSTFDDGCGTATYKKAEGGAPPTTAVEMAR